MDKRIVILDTIEAFLDGHPELENETIVSCDLPVNSSGNPSVIVTIGSDKFEVVCRQI